MVIRINFYLLLEVKVYLLFFRCFDKAVFIELLRRFVSVFGYVVNFREVFVLFRCQLFRQSRRKTNSLLRCRITLYLNHERRAFVCLLVTNVFLVIYGGFEFRVVRIERKIYAKRFTANVHLGNRIAAVVESIAVPAYVRVDLLVGNQFVLYLAVIFLDIFFALFQLRREALLQADNQTRFRIDKIVFVNFSGSAVALAEESRNCDAIVQAWYPGQEGGTAIADVLYGDYNPSGKLPLTFYASDSQLVDYENYDMKGRTYRYFRDEPLYPFGHGLSYTAFTFGKGRVLRKMDGTLEFVVPVENTGSCAGGNVVQLYVSRPDDAEGPVKTLRGYTRIYLESGQRTLARIPIDEETFLWWNPASGRMDPLPGEYILHYGDSSAGSALQTVLYRF